MMMEGGKRVYIYKPGFQTFENCIEFGTKGTSTSKLSFGENSFNLHVQFSFDFQKYLYIKTDFSKFKKLVFKVKNANGNKSWLGYKERHLNTNEDYTDMADSVSVFDTEEKRIVFDISKVTGEQYIFIDGENGASIDVFDIYFE